MQPSDLATAIDLYKTFTSVVGSLWALYSAAVFALLGYVLGTKEPLPGRAKIGLACGFSVFAASNAVALWRVQSITYAAAGAIAQLRERSSPVGTVLGTLVAMPPTCVVAFQVLLSAGVLGAIVAAHRHETWRAKHPK